MMYIEVYEALDVHVNCMYAYDMNMHTQHVEQGCVPEANKV